MLIDKNQFKPKYYIFKIKLNCYYYIRNKRKMDRRTLRLEPGPMEMGDIRT
jgi:hypothetical protein